MQLVAYDDDVPADKAYISASIVATTADGVHVEFSRHRGTDMVLVAFGESEPVPFEDLAVAKDELELNDLLQRAETDADDAFEPVVPFDRVLDMLRRWHDDLPDDLDPTNEDMAAQLLRISDQVVAAGHLFDPRGR